MKLNRISVLTVLGGALTAGSLLLAGPASADTGGSSHGASVGGASHEAIQEGGVLDWIEASNPSSGDAFNQLVNHHNQNTIFDHP